MSQFLFICLFRKHFMSSTSLNTSFSQQVELERGRLEVDIFQSALPPEELFGFAERRNPKRAFLFVSKVLGRHVPVRPSKMQATYTQLAAQIPPDLPSPVVVLGMAETAVGLGAGVHRAYQQLGKEAIYLVSTRHPTGTEVFAHFEEEHSHASAHLIHWPQDPVIKAQLLAARSLVLVDDEASTGNTFINLVKALKTAGLTALEEIVTVTLTDWSKDAVQQQLTEKVSSLALLTGEYRFIENPAAPLPTMPNVSTIGAGNWPINLAKDWGRLGISEHKNTLKLANPPAAGDKVLVVGTNEYVWRPFLLAEQLEQGGADVYFSSTSRSPISLGHTIQTALTFKDNYGLGIDNFLYNVESDKYDRIIICAETGLNSVDEQLVTALNAEVLLEESDLIR